MNSIPEGYFPPLLFGQQNFRDLGGIRSLDGRKLRRNILFRSGDLHSVSDEDVEKMNRLGLAMIIDFRSPREREKRPHRTIPSVKEVVHLPIFDAPRDLAAKYVGEGNGEGLGKLLVDEYRRIVITYIPEYRQFMHEMAHNPNLPAVFQCSAGKDRTGLAAIFLLTALGVGMKEILHDYFLTNIYAQAHAREIISILNNDGHDGELMRPMLEVRQEYLDAGFETINAKFGSLENYVFEELGAEREKLRSRFLE
jgi:protein-tyrosine phosphatase